MKNYFCTTSSIKFDVNNKNEHNVQLEERSISHPARADRMYVPPMPSFFSNHLYRFHLKYGKYNEKLKSLVVKDKVGTENYSNVTIT